MKPWVAILPLFLLLASCGDDPAQGAATQEPVPEATATTPAFSGENAYAHCAQLCALGPRPSGSPAYEAQLRYLEGKLAAYGWKVTRQEFQLTDGTRMTNLHATASAEGKTPPLLISCHIDTKKLPGFIGADDGASAAAAMVELARVLAQDPDLAKQVELVFYDGEESFFGRMNRENSLFGSRYDVAVRQATGTLPLWQINLDMVGGRDKVIAPPALDSDITLLDHYDRAVQALDYSGRHWTIYPGTYLDDHTPFNDIGVPTLNLIAEFSGSNWWHTKRDSLQRISAASLEDTGKLVLQIIRQLLAAE